MAKAAIMGFLLGLVTAPLAVYLYFRLGYAPVATSAPPMPLEKFLANTALAASMARDPVKAEPPAPSEAGYLAAAKTYREDCAVCHGLRGQEQSAIAKGEFPKPPHLLRGKGVTDDPAGETYWKVKNGIRLTGMPGFGQSLSDEQMWQVSQLLANADKLPASVEQELMKP